MYGKQQYHDKTPRCLLSDAPDATPLSEIPLHSVTFFLLSSSLQMSDNLPMGFASACPHRDIMLVI